MLLAAIALAPATFLSLPSPTGADGVRASSLSDDGRVAYGAAHFGGVEGSSRPCRWIAGRAELLPFPKGGSSSPSLAIEDTVGDGSRAVGTVSTREGEQACRWDSGKPTLLPLPSGATSAGAVSVARDGTIVGTARIGGTVRSVLWRGGRVQVLPFPTGYVRFMVARAVSADGRTVVGDLDAKSGSAGNDPRDAWRWTAARGTGILAPRALLRSFPAGVSADGGTVLLIAQERGRDFPHGLPILVDAAGRGKTLDPPNFRADLGGGFLDPTGTLVVLNGVRHRGMGSPALYWTRRGGWVDLDAKLGRTIGSVADVARLSGGRAAFLGTDEDGRPFVATVGL